ncbi:BCCT, betaine/carnitine/choline family transporter [Rhodovulum steppense]|uniref:BCCT, betaine/carnitine/choline family transporter n=2 Tax=Rhodovulum steppense TaxID=540251 RepID=A0A4R1YXM1_9RHOB|nr:BCCT, betaine/carnitine/choline family transporter [Rhodovulum steppense]
MVTCKVPMTALGGGLIALQAVAVSTGLPFTLVLLAACYAIIRGLLNEPR